MLSQISFKRLVAIRSRTAYKVLLNLLPTPRIAPKPELDLTLLTMCGAKHLGFLQQCLFSLYNSWSSIPKLQVFSDGTLTLSKLEETLSWWSGTKSFSSWEESVYYHQQQGRDALVKYAKNSISARKLAVILASGELRETLWCDCDILWFKELSDLPITDKQCSLPVLKISLDNQQAYDNQLIEQAQLEHLYQLPFINSGLVFLKGNLLEVCHLDNLIKIAAEKSIFCTEQTIFAEAAYQLGQNFWSPEEVACFEDDKFSLLPNYEGKQWAARHYAGPTRHLFSRDAFALRLGLGSQLFAKGHY